MGRNSKGSNSRRSSSRAGNSTRRRLFTKCNSVSGSISVSGDGDSESTPRRTATQPAQARNYNFNSVRTNDLVELIRLWHRCTCLWNKPARLVSPRMERLHAYQLLVLKAKKFDPNVKFLQLKKIVHQLKNIYVNRLTACKKEDIQESMYGLNSAKVNIILSELSFLEDSFESNIPEVEDTICPFCEANYHKAEILWNHMVNTHAPGVKKTRKFSPKETESQSDSEKVVEPKLPAISTNSNSATPYSRRLYSMTKILRKRETYAKPVKTEEESRSEAETNVKPKSSARSAEPTSSTIRPTILLQPATLAQSARLAMRRATSTSSSRYSRYKNSETATSTKQNTSANPTALEWSATSPEPSTSMSAGANTRHMDTEPSVNRSKSFRRRLALLRKSNILPRSPRMSDSECQHRKNDEGSYEAEKNQSWSVSYNFETTTDGNTTTTTTGTCTDTSYATDVSISKSTVRRRDRLFLTEYDDKFLEDFIDSYKKQECLWNQNANLYNNRKMRSGAYNTLATMYRCAHNGVINDVTKVKRLIRRLRARFNELQKPYADNYRSNIWQRLGFIEDGRNPKARARKQIRLEKQYSGELICNKCNRPFQREQHLKYHMLKEHPFLECAQCRQSFSDADKLKEHILSQHEEDKQCPLGCSSDRDWKSSLHLSEHFYTYLCKVCLKVFHDAANFKNHKLKCRIKCKKCGATFSTILDYRRHSRVNHKETCPFECATCGATFKYMKAWSLHLKDHRRTDKAN